MSHLISAQLITRHEGWLPFRSIYLPSMGYSLSSTSFPRRALAKIQSSPIRALLPAMGFNRIMPLEVVFGPNSIGGIGLRLYVGQGCQKTSSLLQYARQNSRLGKNDVDCNPVDPSHSRSLQEENVNILAASDAATRMTTAPLTGNHMGMRRHRARLPNAVLPCGRIRPHAFTPVFDSLHSLRMTRVSRLTVTMKALLRTRRPFTTGMWTRRAGT
jgi:hypothetical protein